MIKAQEIYNNSNLQNQIWNSVNELNYSQQLKLLDFINSLFLKSGSKNTELSKYTGLFDREDLNTIKNSIKECEQIDLNEW